MLPRAHRLPARLTLQKYSTCRCSFGFIKCAENKLEYARVGVVVSKKVTKHAVERNRIRRVIHSIFQGMPDILNRNNDVLIIVQKNISDQQFASIKEELEELFL